MIFLLWFQLLWFLYYSKFEIFTKNNYFNRTVEDENIIIILCNGFPFACFKPMDYNYSIDTGNTIPTYLLKLLYCKNNI